MRRQLPTPLASAVPRDNPANKVFGSGKAGMVATRAAIIVEETTESQIPDSTSHLPTFHLRPSTTLDSEAVRERRPHAELCFKAHWSPSFATSELSSLFEA